jgi:YcxB-like protein
LNDVDQVYGVTDVNPYRPPEADPDGPTGLSTAQTVLRYRIGRVDLALWNFFHQLRMPFMHVVFVGLSLIVASDGATPSAKVLAGLWIYLGAWVLNGALVALAVTLMRSDSPLFAAHTVELLDDALQVSTPYAHCRYSWSGIRRVLAAPGFLAVYINNNVAYVIPDRAFTGPQGRAQCAAALRAHVALAQAAGTTAIHRDFR